MSSDPLSRTVAGARAMALFERGVTWPCWAGCWRMRGLARGGWLWSRGRRGSARRACSTRRAAADGLGLEVCMRAAASGRDFGFGVVRQLLEPRVAVAGESERAELFGAAQRAWRRP